SRMSWKSVTPSITRIGSPVLGFLIFRPPSSRPKKIGFGTMLASVVLPVPLLAYRTIFSPSLASVHVLIANVLGVWAGADGLPAGGLISFGLAVGGALGIVGGFVLTGILCLSKFTVQPVDYRDQTGLFSFD